MITPPDDIVGRVVSARLGQVPGGAVVVETLPGYHGTLWIGLFAPVGTPPDIQAALEKAMAPVAGAAREGRVRR